LPDEEANSAGNLNKDRTFLAESMTGWAPLDQAAVQSSRMRALLAPVIVILALGFAVLVVAIGYFVHVQDQTEIQKSEAITRTSLDVEKQQISDILDSYAWWDEAVDQVRGKLDPKWLDDNVGSYQTQSHDITASFIVGSSDETLVAFIDGKSVNATALGSLKGGLDLLIKWTRLSSQIEPAAATGILMLGNQPMVVGAEAITPELGSPLWPADKPRCVLIFGRPFDRALLDRVSNRAGATGLRVLGEREAPLLATLPLVNPNGTTVASLTWPPDLPALRLIWPLIPFIGALLAIALGLLWWFLHRLRAVGDTLHRQAIVIHQIQDAIFGADFDGAIANWNAGAARMFGFSREQVIGQPLSLIYPDLSPQMLADGVEAFRAGKESVELQVSARRKSGDVFPAHLSLFPVKGDHGEVVGTIGYGLDISKQKQLEAKLEELATVDELTGAYNRRYLQTHAPVEVQRAQRFKRPLSFLFLDLDHFKRVNDRFGHPFGDLVLAMFSTVCRRALRPSDVLVRYGGEEFLVMLPEAGLDQALAVAQRLASDVKQTRFSLDPPFQGLTVSIGVSELRQSGDSFEAILERVDRATYRAKQLGRDRIETEL